jgi:riboflavin synthase alpha subunit
VFTGIVRERAAVVSSGKGRLVVESSLEPEIGDSISVDGVCLTVSGRENGRLAFDVMEETLARAKPFRGEVNLEPALRAGDPLGGHFVQGHVDGVAAVAGLHTRGEHRVTLRPPPDLMPFVTPRGSVCLDGVSLTIARVDPAGGTFDVALIPTTLDLTTLGSLREGSRVNLEADVLARTMVHWLRHYTDHRV